MRAVSCPWSVVSCFWKTSLTSLFRTGYYDRDNDFHVNWRNISKDPAKFDRYLEEWIYEVRNRAEYVEKMGDQITRLKAKDQFYEPVNYGY